MKKLLFVIGLLAFSGSPICAQAAYVVRVPIAQIVASSTTSSTSPTSSNPPSAIPAALFVNYADGAMKAGSPNFGDVPVGSTCLNGCQDIAIENGSSTNITITGISTLAAPLQVETSKASPSCTAGYVLTPYSTCYLDVGYSAMTSGTTNQTLTVTGSNSQTLSISASATGVSSPAPLWSPSGVQEYFMGVVGTVNDPRTSLGLQTVSSTDTGSYTITSVSLTSGSPFALDQNASCLPGTVVSASSPCSISFQYSPTQAGTQTATAAVTYQDQNGNSYTYTFYLSGSTENVPSTTVQVYELNGAFYGFELDAVGGWGSPTMQSMASVSNDPWNMYANVSDVYSASDYSTQAATIISPSSPLANPYPTGTVGTSGPPADSLTQAGPLTIDIGLGNYTDSIYVVLPQENLTFDANNVGSASFCVSWQYETGSAWSAAASGDQYGSIQGWVGTAVLGACP